MVRRALFASLLAVLGMAIAPQGAGAATRLGQTFDPSFACQPDVTILQSVSPGLTYAATSDGVITSWSFQAPATGSALLRFKVARPVGSRFKIVGESALVSPTPGTLNTYPARIPVHAGDLIGLYWNAGDTGFCAAIRDGFHIRNHNGDVATGTTAPFTEQTVFQLDLSAVVEPDCDQNGLGDESQQQSAPPCPTCAGQPATIIGTNGNDARDGTPGRDVMVGLGGKDKLNGLSGNDIICGGPGKDTLSGGKGNDKLLGGPGRDTLTGGPGKDKLKGGPGKDKQVQ